MSTKSCTSKVHSPAAATISVGRFVSKAVFDCGANGAPFSSIAIGLSSIFRAFDVNVALCITTAVRPAGGNLILWCASPGCPRRGGGRGVNP